jgi:hypothetical protein
VSTTKKSTAISTGPQSPDPMARLLPPSVRESFSKQLASINRTTMVTTDYVCRAVPCRPWPAGMKLSVAVEGKTECSKWTWTTKRIHHSSEAPRLHACPCTCYTGSGKFGRSPVFCDHLALCSTQS